jgi:hypothetical protein
MARGNTKRRMTGVIAGAALGTVVTPVLAACSSGGSGDAAASAKPTASATAEVSGTHPAGQSSGGGQATAQQAVAQWLTDLLKHDYREVCSETAEPASKGQPAEITPAATCVNKKAMAQTTALYDTYRTAFTPNGASGTPKIEVDEKPVKGKIVTWPAKAITVDGQRLNKITMSHSQGFQTRTTFQAVEVNGSWYTGTVEMIKSPGPVSGGSGGSESVTGGTANGGTVTGKY